MQDLVPSASCVVLSTWSPPTGATCIRTFKCECAYVAYLLCAVLVPRCRRGRVPRCLPASTIHVDGAPRCAHTRHVCKCMCVCVCMYVWLHVCVCVVVVCVLFVYVYMMCVRMHVCGCMCAFVVCTSHVVCVLSVCVVYVYVCVYVCVCVCVVLVYVCFCFVCFSCVLCV